MRDSAHVPLRVSANGAAIAAPWYNLRVRARACSMEESSPAHTRVCWRAHTHTFKMSPCQRHALVGSAEKQARSPVADQLQVPRRCASNHKRRYCERLRPSACAMKFVKMSSCRADVEGDADK